MLLFVRTSEISCFLLLSKTKDVFALAFQRSLVHTVVSDLYWNDFSGTMPAEVCAHFNGIPAEYRNFSSLQVDCDVECDDLFCCTDPCV